MSIYTFDENHKENFAILLRHVEDMTPSEATIVVGINAFAHRTGKVSYKQLQIVGIVYKRLVQRGRYSDHNWKIWK